jgi:hypothetical protein
MPWRAFTAVFLAAHDTEQGGNPDSGETGSQRSRPRFGVRSLERTVRREQTRVTGYGCRRGANLRRVSRRWESPIAPKHAAEKSVTRHERSGRNPANPRSGDGMQQARAPSAEKAVGVVHVPQGRNESPGRHARDRTARQRCRAGEWTQEGQNRRRGKRQAHGSVVAREGFTACCARPASSVARRRGQLYTTGQKTFYEVHGAPSGDLQPAPR